MPSESSLVRAFLNLEDYIHLVKSHCASADQKLSDSFSHRLTHSILDSFSADPSKCFGEIFEKKQPVMLSDELEDRAPDHPFHGFAFHKA
jgi:hypothetical protein